MYGAIASMALLQGGGTYTPVDPDALAYADFVAQVYEVDQAESSLTAMFSGTDAGEFSASGMKVAFDNSNRPEATGALKTAIESGLANGITLLFEMDMETTGAGGTLFGVNDTAITDEIWLNSQPGALDSVSLNFGTSSLSMNLPGINRIAFVLSRNIGGGSYRNAVSVNGSAVDGSSGAKWQNLAYALASQFSDFASIKLGDVSDWDLTNDSEFFRKFAVYGPMTDAELVTLSTL